jgi:hypothetical protein
VVEATDKAKRRQHSAAYKQKLLQQGGGLHEVWQVGSTVAPRAAFFVAPGPVANGASGSREEKRLGPQPKASNPHDQKGVEQERIAVLSLLPEPRFANPALAEVDATLLDENRHLCFESTMNHLLSDNSGIRERQSQLLRQHQSPPKLPATAPKQLMLPPIRLEAYYERWMMTALR